MVKMKLLRLLRSSRSQDRWCRQRRPAVNDDTSADGAPGGPAGGPPPPPPPPPAAAAAAEGPAPAGGGATLPPAVASAMPAGAAGAGAGAPNAPAASAPGAAVDPAAAVAEPPVPVLAVTVCVDDMAEHTKKVILQYRLPNHVFLSTFFKGTGGSGITSGFGAPFARALQAVDSRNNLGRSSARTAATPGRAISELIGLSADRRLSHQFTS